MVEYIQTKRDPFYIVLKFYGTIRYTVNFTGYAVKIV